ncbi:hypothetical protein NGM99_13945 [Mesorhizobium sp. RP14(2022)]|uniref:Uncharacterized protein n=1 Tax=Mesorhizobium liriopis TaxID=2953882 RepID=A0ABT1C7R8_9HYPH|nr:hypothetical protein [Mesorhizobium liriopis]MCO6050882.1 hypothetical protein [Mesorhizobium liriopis]
MRETILALQTRLAQLVVECDAARTDKDGKRIDTALHDIGLTYVALHHLTPPDEQKHIAEAVIALGDRVATVRRAA